MTSRSLDSGLSFLDATTVGHVLISSPREGLLDYEMDKETHSYGERVVETVGRKKKIHKQVE